jgi:hypothetical protein
MTTTDPAQEAVSPPNHRGIAAEISAEIVPGNIREGLLQAGCGPGAVTFQDKGGLVLQRVQVVLIFWGTAWTQNPIPSANAVINAIREILGGGYMAKLSQYRGIQKGTLVATDINGASSPNPQFTDNEVTGMIQARIANRNVPAPTANSLYVVLMPTTVSSKDHPQFIGLHGTFSVGGTRTFFAWVMNDGTLNGNNSLPRVFSHELAEACSDPDPNTPAITTTVPGVTGDEIGDVCINCIAVVNNVARQAYWSQADGQCVLPVEQLDGYVVGREGQVFTNFVVDNGPFNGWTALADPRFPDGFTVPPGSPVSAVKRNDRQLDLFVVGREGQVFTNFVVDNGPFNGWTALADPRFPDGFTVPPGSPVSAVLRSP